MKRLLAVLLAAAIALPVAADTQVVCTITAQAQTACSAITVSEAARLDPCRCNANGGGGGAEPSVYDDAIALWKLDEASGTRADSIGSNDLTDNNTVGYANLGPQGVVASFAFGAVEYLTDVPVAITLGDTDWTIAAWVKPTASQVSEPIFSKGSGGTNSCLLWLSTNQPQLYTRNFNDLVSAPAGSAPNDKWTYVVAYHDSVNNLIGISVDGGAFTTAATGAANSSNATALEVGGRVGSYFYDGNIARAAKWDRVLSAADALALYNSGVGKSYTDLTTAEKVGLVSYWNLDEASGNRADSHGSNTLTDNNTVGSATNSYPANLPGRVASFVEGNSEYLSRANADLTNWPQGDFHFAVWATRTGTDADFEENYASKLISTGDQREWRIHTAIGQDRLYLAASSDGTSEDAGANTGAGSFPVNTWHLLELRRSGTTIGAAIDGGAFADASVSGVFNGTAAFVLGARNSGTFGYHDGMLSTAALWPRVLTPDERAALYNSGDGAVLP